MRELVNYFAHRHLLANILFFSVLFIGAFAWHSIGKEEMPEFESNWVRVNSLYPGAPAEDVELFVTKPIEDELKGVVGIDEIATTSSLGLSSFRIILEDSYPDKSEVVQEIQDAVLRARLPAEVRDLPRIRQFKSSEKAIMDVGIYHLEHDTLNSEAREELQQFVQSFENQILVRPEISSISRSNYLKPELQIIIDPYKMRENNVSLAQVSSQIKDNNIRFPIGSLNDRGESKVTALNELETVEGLQELVLQGNFTGHGVKLADISHSIRRGHEKANSIFKVNGHEAVFLNIKKSISADILTAQSVILDFIEKFKRANKGNNIGITLMDDESYEVRNRLNIVTYNGFLGFVLIVMVLFLFLNVKTGFWVAMGIPFCICFTLLVASLFDYTVNNMTLAGIIIVLGIVVDDAIIIAENISRHKEGGKPIHKAAVDGTIEVFRPILASIITTCVAFVPLMFFEGFFGKLVTYIPLIVILMLLGSLLESLYVLPAHMSGRSTFWQKAIGKFPKLKSFGGGANERKWFKSIEHKYERLLRKVFDFRSLLVGVFLTLLVLAGYLFDSKMSFVMFPREESKEVFIKVTAPKEATRVETSQLIAPLEKKLAGDEENVVGVRSSVGVSRRGGAIKENEASILVELRPRDERKVPLNILLEDWEKFSKNMSGLESVKFQRGRWGHGSGNSIEIQIQENNDKKREEIAEAIEKAMKDRPDFIDVEIDKPLTKKEYILKLIQPNLIRLDVSPSAVTTVLRSFVEGNILYSINKGEEEVDVRLTVPETDKHSLKELLNLRVNNGRGNLVKLNNVVKIQEVERPINISRTNFKRSTMVFANVKPGSKLTPLRAAETLENEVFPEIEGKFPTSLISFRGEVEDSRESQGEFRNSVFIVVCLIYLILAIMFNSLTRPFLVLSIVPFGMAGVVFVLLSHGMSIYGFFAVIGAIGMIGVVINDAIVMIDKFERTMVMADNHPWDTIATVATTRLRPVILTTLTTTVGILPTAYGFAGYDSMLAEMMLTMGWGLAFGTVITLFLIPCLYTYIYKKPSIAS